MEMAMKKLILTFLLLTSFNAFASLTLEGTWQLVEFRSNSDAVGIKTPDYPANYTMTLRQNGSVSMQLNCNRGTGSYKALKSSGQITFKPMVVTRALCPPPSMDEFIAMQMEYVQSYIIENDRLYFNLMADGGTFVWESMIKDNAYRAGQEDFDAAGMIPCKIYKGQPTHSCNYGVARSDNGNATVSITKDDGRKRAIFFVKGKPLSADTSQADWGEFSSEKEADLHIVKIGFERYEIPHAVITGD